MAHHVARGTALANDVLVRGRQSSKERRGAMDEMRRSTLFFVLSVGCALAWPCCAALESGDYQTLPGATVEERGDRVPNRSRVVPISATVTFDLSATPPSLAARIPTAVLEGGEPFPLTVRSLSGARLIDGTYRFTGDYLRDIYPSGTQYFFDWSFSPAADGRVVWNGVTGWAGGHIWLVTISNIVLVPQPRLSISWVGAASVRLTWATNFADYVLECSTDWPEAAWSTVTNAVDTAGDRFAVTMEAEAPKRFYRLRHNAWRALPRPPSTSFP
jgi:hypothetical protein